MSRSLHQTMFVLPLDVGANYHSVIWTAFSVGFQVSVTRIVIVALVSPHHTHS